MYQATQPFPHIAFDNFFSVNLLKSAASEFPLPKDGKWWEYKNVLEKKLARDDVDNFPVVLRSLIYEMQSNRFVSLLEKITGITGLIVDHTVNGGGLHQIIPGGFLDIHADYNYHPITSLDRRLNVILYLNENWKEEWGGKLEMWNKEMSKCQSKYSPMFNRLVIFNVDDWAYHGHPDPLKCPEGESRKSIALYYYTNGRPIAETTPKHSVLFQKRPQDLNSEEKEALRIKRSKGRI